MLIAWVVGADDLMGLTLYREERERDTRKYIQRLMIGLS